MSDPLSDVAASVGKPYGMTAEQTIAHLLLGDRQHADAPEDECGAADPRNEAVWCRRPIDHVRDFHHPYREESDWGEPFRWGAGMGPGGHYRSGDSGGT